MDPIADLRLSPKPLQVRILDPTAALNKWGVSSILLLSLLLVLLSMSMKMILFLLLLLI